MRSRYGHVAVFVVSCGHRITVRTNLCAQHPYFKGLVPLVGRGHTLLLFPLSRSLLSLAESESVPSPALSLLSLLSSISSLSSLSLPSIPRPASTHTTLLDSEIRLTWLSRVSASTPHPDCIKSVDFVRRHSVSYATKTVRFCYDTALQYPAVVLPSPQRDDKVEVQKQYTRRSSLA
jgi:hypothetical protein